MNIVQLTDRELMLIIRLLSEKALTVRAAPYLYDEILELYVTLSKCKS
jgi:hypothetical protein